MSVADPLAEDRLVVLIPQYNEWGALGLLLEDLDRVFTSLQRPAHVVIIDDGSTVDAPSDFPGFTLKSLGPLTLLTLRRNLGHQRAIAIGLAYVQDKLPCSAVILMDSDGEDAPSDIPMLLERFAQEGRQMIVFAERTRRSETLLFVGFYNLYKLVHYILTGYKVRVGNFSVIPRKRLDSLVVVSEIWNHYAAAVFRSNQPYCAIPTQRAHRLSGKSRMNFVKLVVHGLSAISLYSDIIGVRMLMMSMSLGVLTVLAMVLMILIGAITQLALPGWTATIFGILLLILFQSVMFSILFSFIILGGRQGTSFLPCRDYVWYVGGVSKLRGDVHEKAHSQTAG